MHPFYSTQGAAVKAKAFEAKHGPNNLFDRPLILLSEIVQVFDLTNLDGLTRFLLERIQVKVLAQLLSQSFQLDEIRELMIRPPKADNCVFSGS